MRTFEEAAFLAESAGHQAPPDQGKPLARKRWIEAEQYSRAVVRGSAEGVPVDLVRLRARCLAAVNQKNEAVAELKTLLTFRPPGNPLRGVLWAEIARIEDESRQYDKEIQAWQQSLGARPPPGGRLAPREPLAAAKALGEEAQCRCQLGQVLCKAGRLGEARENSNSVPLNIPARSISSPQKRSHSGKRMKPKPSGPSCSRAESKRPSAIRLLQPSNRPLC